MPKKHDHDHKEYSKNKIEPADDPNPLYLDFNFDLNYDDEFNFHQQQNGVLCNDPTNAIMNVADYGIDPQYFQYATENNVDHQQQQMHHHHHHPEQHLEVAADQNSGLAFVDFNSLVSSTITSCDTHHPDQMVFTTTDETTTPTIQYYIDETSGQLMIKEQLQEPVEPQIIVCKPRRVKQPVRRVAAVVQSEAQPTPLTESITTDVELNVRRNQRAKRKQSHIALLQLLDDDFDFSVAFDDTAKAAIAASPKRIVKLSAESIAGTPCRPSKRLLDKNWKNFSKKRILTSLEPSDSDDWKTDQECEIQGGVRKANNGDNKCDKNLARFECVKCGNVFWTRRLFIGHMNQCFRTTESLTKSTEGDTRVDDKNNVKTNRIANHTGDKENMGIHVEGKTCRKKRIVL